MWRTFPIIHVWPILYSISRPSNRRWFLKGDVALKFDDWDYSFFVILYIFYARLVDYCQNLSKNMAWNNKKKYHVVYWWPLGSNLNDDMQEFHITAKLDHSFDLHYPKSLQFLKKKKIKKLLFQMAISWKWYNTTPLRNGVIRIMIGTKLLCTPRIRKFYKLFLQYTCDKLLN